MTNGITDAEIQEKDIMLKEVEEIQNALAEGNDAAARKFFLSFHFFYVIFFFTHVQKRNQTEVAI